MRLEWFRSHKGKVYLVSAIVVIPGMVLFGSLNKFSGSGGARSHPSGWYNHLDGTREDVSGAELHAQRLLLSRYSDRGAIGSQRVIQHLAAIQIARDLGLETGTEELVSELRDNIKGRTGKDRVTEELHKTLLENLHLSEGQFERISRDVSLLGKYTLALRQAKVTDEALFVSYLRERAPVRLLYQEFRSKDYEEKAGKPQAEKVKEYFEKHKDAAESDADALRTKPTLSADVLYVSTKDAEKELKPTDEDLKKHYEQYKPMYRKEAEPGKPAPEGEAAFKPYEEVKEQVLKDYRLGHLSTKAAELIEKATKELAEQETKAKAAPEYKPVDLAAFAKSKGLQHWRTKDLTREEFNKGTDKVGAEDFKLSADLFYLAEPDADAEREKGKAEKRKAFQRARRIGLAPDDGFAAMRVGAYQAARKMSLEEASARIERRLLEEAALDLARKAADETREKWVKGEGIPKAEDLKDETIAHETTNELAQAYFEKPLPVGEILPVAAEPDTEKGNDPESRRQRFLVGFAAERTIHPFDYFEKDVAYNRDQQRKQQTNFRQRFLMELGNKYLLTLAKPGSTRIEDPPVFTDTPGPGPSDE